MCLANYKRYILMVFRIVGAIYSFAIARSEHMVSARGSPRMWWWQLERWLFHLRLLTLLRIKFRL